MKQKIKKCKHITCDIIYNIYKSKICPLCKLELENKILNVEYKLLKIKIKDLERENNLF
jgi:hypothetical protein